MQLHPLAGAAVCPHCRGPQLEYLRQARHGDMYKCGGCGGQLVHRRRKGLPGCGLVPVLMWGYEGDWSECKGQPQSPAAEGQQA